MKPYGALNPIDQIPGPPDTIQTLLIAASSGQALDWASTLAQIARFTGQSTAGAQMNFYAALNSTSAAVPSSGASTGSTGGALPVVPVLGTRTLQIPGGSTGFSLAALSSGYVTVELWNK